MLKKIINKLYKWYYTSSSDKYIKHLKSKRVKIGKGTFVLDPKHIQIDITRPELLEIGENVFLHRGTIILTHDWASWCFVNSDAKFYPSHGRVKIGNNVWLGENVTILKGVTIGNNVIIGLGAIVTRDIPSNSIAIGSPAKVIGSYDDYMERRSKLYIDEAIDYARAILDSGREPQIDDFYDDYPCFVNGGNYMNYDYPYKRIFRCEELFEVWKRNHKSVFKNFDDFINHVKQSHV